MTKQYDGLSKKEAEAHCEAYAASLGPRLAWFTDLVASTGGPGSALDGSVESLDAVGEWLVQQRSDVGAPREGHDLPLWVAHEPGFTSTWGPGLLLLADGLVAYMAECYRTRWPDTVWRMHEGRPSDVDYRQPMLWVDGGRSRVNLPHIATSIVHRALVAATDTDPGRLRRVWETWAPKD